MDVFVYVEIGSTTPRDEIEDEIEAILSDRGEVTGGGAGNKGFNIDIEIFDENDKYIVEEIKSALRNLNLPRSSTIVIDGQSFFLYE